MISSEDIGVFREAGDISHASKYDGGGEVNVRLTRDGVVSLPVHASHETQPELGP